MTYWHASQFPDRSDAKILSWMMWIAKVFFQESGSGVYYPQNLVETKRVPPLFECETGGVVVNDLFAIRKVLVIICDTLH